MRTISLQLKIWQTENRPVLIRAQRNSGRLRRERAPRVAKRGWLCNDGRMAKIEDLIAHIPDERLRKAIAAEVRDTRFFSVRALAREPASINILFLD